MGWFSRAPKTPASDPIGEICRILAERPHEWRMDVTDDADKDACLVHVTGVTIAYRYENVSRTYIPDFHARVWFCSHADGRLAELPRRDAARVYTAIQSQAAALVARRPYRFTDAALALAESVRSGDHSAALALCDEILEHHNKGGAA